MRNALQLFERAVISVVIYLMAALILVLVVDLGWTIFRHIIGNPLGLLESADLLDVFGSFLLVVIAVELLETIKAYLNEHVVHAELVLEVALIAVARKIIVLDMKAMPAWSVLAIGALVLMLASAYWLEGRRRKKASASADQQDAERPRA